MKLPIVPETLIVGKIVPPNSQGCSNGSLQDSIKALVSDKRGNADIEVIKAKDLIEMENLLREVFTIIRFKNLFVLANISAHEVLAFIESQSSAYLELFGLALCRRVAEPIIKMRHMPFTNKSTFFDFYDLCQIEKRREDSEKENLKRNETSERQRPTKSLKEMLGLISLNK